MKDKLEELMHEFHVEDILAMMVEICKENADAQMDPKARNDFDHQAFAIGKAVKILESPPY